nr:toxin PIN [Mobiluncus mulieris]
MWSSSQRDNHVVWWVPRSTQKLAAAGLKPKTQALLEILAANPLTSPPRFKKLSGHYRQIRAELQNQRKIIGANDLHLAAHARFLGLVLVTNNTREFAPLSST